MSKYDKLFNFNKKIQNTYGLFVNIKRLPYMIKSKSILQRNDKLLSYKKSDKCYVLGLGPSLANVDPEKLHDGDIIAVNNFFAYANSHRFHPDFYVLMDNHYYSSDFQENDRIRAFESFPSTTFILNGRYYSKKLDIKDKTFWLYAWKGYSAINSNMSLTKVMPAFDNVICNAISIAICMRYKEIVLLGCDFNSFATPKIQHCYCTEGEKRDMSLSFEMFVYSFVAEQHRLLNISAISNDLRIINSTKDSLLDVYPRENEDYYLIKEGK